MEDEDEFSTALFPLPSVSHTAAPAVTATQTVPTGNVPQWLSNTSFTTNLSVINNAVSSNYSVLQEEEPEEDEPRTQSRSSPKYGLLESSASDPGSDAESGKRKKRKKRKRKRPSGRGEEYDLLNSRKLGVESLFRDKEYYFDARGDHDNLAFGSLYRMDIARYKHHLSAEMSGLELQSLYARSRRSSILDRDGDVDELDDKIKSGGRYWSAKYAALERHKDLSRLRILKDKKVSTIPPPGNFVPLLDAEDSCQGVNNGSLPRMLTIEESWEDEVLRKTKEFNKMTREHPQNEKVWIDFAEFQDKVASMQRQKGARLQTLEKKISILEKAMELNPENEELLLYLLKVYHSRDSTDVLIGRWEKALMEHSDSYKLWKEFLRVVQGEFSRFKVSELRKLYAHAIQALAAACSRQHRQAHRACGELSEDPALTQLELNLVDIFVSLCRFEWQAGYQELSTALFQAEIEYSMFCPSLFLTEQSKERLFEHFWNSDGARIGEKGALGWSAWLEKEEEHRQNVIRDESSQEKEEGGWTGWSEPLSRGDTVGSISENLNLDVKEVEEESEMVGTKQEDDVEALLKMLGIDVNAEADGEVNDASTWARWSEEEYSRDYDQWMPVRTKLEVPPTDVTPEKEADEQLMRVIIFEDISEYLFSLNSAQARICLVSQFIDFFGGRISQWASSNSSSWTGKTLSLEALPDSILEDLRRIHNILTMRRDCSSCCSLQIESLLGGTDDIARRTSMMKFLREATLLCLTVLPRNYVLEEAILLAEELSTMEMNSTSRSVTPCRSLAKSLLKSDRQDILLCGVYARREAAYGNVDLARKVFDMAVSSVQVLPPDVKSTAPILYLWYAEMELDNDFGSDSESSLRATHVLACLGSGVTYTPFKGQPSGLLLLRAHQGYKEQIRALRSAWARGVIDDPSVALICSASLFEELTTGGTAGTEVFDHALSMVLPERRRQSHHLELLFYYQLSMVQNRRKHRKLSEVWETILRGLQLYPFSPKLLGDLVEIGHLYTVPNKLRLIFDDFCHKKPSIIVLIFAISYEISTGGSRHRILGLLERALANEELHSSVILWRCYIAYEINVAGDLSAAKRIFFRAIHACPWSKKLWLDGFRKLNSVLTAKEMSDLQEVMREKELNLRTDIYEILLQDEDKS